MLQVRTRRPTEATSAVHIPQQLSEGAAGPRPEVFLSHRCGALLTTLPSWCVWLGRRNTWILEHARIPASPRVRVTLEMSLSLSEA